MRLGVRWRFKVLPAVSIAFLGLLLIGSVFTDQQQLHFHYASSSATRTRDSLKMPPTQTLTAVPPSHWPLNKGGEVRSFVGKLSSPSTAEAAASLCSEQSGGIEMTGREEGGEARKRTQKEGSKQQATIMTLRQQQQLLQQDDTSSFLSSNRTSDGRQLEQMRQLKQEKQKQKQPSEGSSNLVKLERTSSSWSAAGWNSAHSELNGSEWTGDGAQLMLDGQLNDARGTRLVALRRRPARSASSSLLAEFNSPLVGLTKQQPARVQQRIPLLPDSDLREQQRAPLMVQAVLGERVLIACANLSASSLLPVPVGAQPDSSLLAGEPASLSASTRRRPRPSSASCPNSRSVSLIVWYKNEQLDSPIFSADAREASSLRNSRQQTGSQSLKNRARLDEYYSGQLEMPSSVSHSQTTPVLVIEQATAHDAGLYTCTLEFCKAPTQTHQVRLQIVHPPRDMSIRDHNNQLADPPGALIGPYDEHSHLTLTCQVQTPGNPPAQLHWWRLKSVSSLPLSSASSSIILPTDNQQPSNITTPDHYYLTTMELLSEAGGQSMQNSRSNDSKTNYFVALQPASQEVNLTKLPFKNGYRLKHWTRFHSSKLSPNTLASSDSMQASTIETTIEVGSLSRADQGEEFLCLARNNDLSSPLNSSVRISMNLRPTEVKIVNKPNNLFKLNQKTTVECQVLGSKPSAEISWFRGNLVLNLAKHKQSERVEVNDDDSLSNLTHHHPEYTSEINRDFHNSNDMIKVSYLTLIPQMNDNQQSLTCSAYNPAIPNSMPMSDSIIMNVLFPAQMKLQLGTGIKEDSIRLGSDVFMDCNIHSNPPITDISWLFNDQPVNLTNTGIIMSKLSLVIQNIRLQHRGQYQCVGQNALGTFHSNKLALKPLFEPICDYTRTKTRYEISVNQAMRIECNVLAEPDDGLEFDWKFNQTVDELKGDEQSSSASYLDEMLKQFETNFTKSTVIFKPTTRLQHGQLLCSASNLEGKQQKPCIIQVIVSELPDPVFSCWFDNHTNTSFSIHCQSSQQSSTSRQTYLLELHTNESISSTLFEDDSSHMDTRATTSFNNIKHRKESSSLSNVEDENIVGLMVNSGKRAQAIKKLNSDTPTFYVDNLEPGTSYNAVIYVQNSKGLSVPVFYQTNTLPNGGPNLRSLTSLVEVDKNVASLVESPRLSDKLISFLKVGNYLKSDYSKFVVVAMIVLLSSTLIVILAFFATRLCKPNSQLPEAKKGARERKKSGRSLSSDSAAAAAAAESLAEKSVDSTKKMVTYDKSKSQVERNVHLALATPLRLKGLAGSGSDTSRETNTDSTLISLYRYGATKVVPSQLPPLSNDLLLQQQHHQQQEYTVDEQGSIHNNNRLTHNNNSNSNNNNNSNSNNRGLQNNQSTNSLLRVYTKQSYPTRTNPTTPSPIPIIKQQQQEEARQVNDPRRAFNCNQMMSNPNGPQPANESDQPQMTPQVSMQSDSDCTSTNELQADASDFHDRFLISYHNNLSEPIYVIGAGNDSPHQLCLINPASLCPHSDPIEYGGTGCGNNHSQLGNGTSSMTTSSFDRTQNTSNYAPNVNTSSNCPSMFVRNPPPVQQPPELQQLPIGFLANSASIPVSLSECPHSLRVQQRRSSHEYLTEDLCLDGTTLNMSYLTLR